MEQHRLLHNLHRTLLGTLLLTLSACQTQPHFGMSEITTTQVLAALAEEEDLSTDELLEYRRNPQAIPEFIHAVKGGADTMRLASIGTLVDLGRPIIPPQGYVAEHLGPILTEATVVDALVTLLIDPNPDVRNEACVNLAGLAPGEMIASRATLVIGALEQFPETDGALVLLGKTATPAALELLDRDPKLSASNPDDARMARARLGNSEHEQYFLDAYARAELTIARVQLARRLGYMGTPKAVAALAQDIRSPITYAWQRSAQRSFRLHVIEGLHLAFLTEPIFWKPILRPDDDTYYEAIEAWLSKRVGMTWETPRPPFLYEQVVPLPSQARPTPATRKNQ